MLQLSWFAIAFLTYFILFSRAAWRDGSSDPPHVQPFAVLLPKQSWSTAGLLCCTPGGFPFGCWLFTAQQLHFAELELLPSAQRTLKWWKKYFFFSFLFANIELAVSNRLARAGRALEIPFFSLLKGQSSTGAELPVGQAWLLPSFCAAVTLLFGKMNWRKLSHNWGKKSQEETKKCGLSAQVWALCAAASASALHREWWRVRGPLFSGCRWFVHSKGTWASCQLEEKKASPSFLPSFLLSFFFPSFLPFSSLRTHEVCPAKLCIQLLALWFLANSWCTTAPKGRRKGSGSFPHKLWGCSCTMLQHCGFGEWGISVCLHCVTACSL